MFGKSVMQITNFKNKGVFYMLENYPNDVLSVSELCAILRVGRNSAYNLLQTGAIHSRKLKRKYIIPKISVIQYMEEAEKNDK